MIALDARGGKARMAVALRLLATEREAIPLDEQLGELWRLASLRARSFRILPAQIVPQPLRVSLEEVRDERQLVGIVARA